MLLLSVLRVTVLAPERCPPPGPAATDNAIEAAVAWLTANVEPDGRFLYRYQPEEDLVVPGYHIVRHAGALVALEQAATAGWPAAAEAAEAGWAFVERNLVDVQDGLAFLDSGAMADTGAAALAVVAWTMRHQRQGPAAAQGDAQILGLGRFLVGQVEATGAVASARDRSSGALLGPRSRFYTGEVAWALQRLAVAYPGGGFDEPAARVLRYLVHERDRVERWFPAVADHWAAYALADAAQPELFAERADGYRRVLAGRFAIQVRWESQRRVGQLRSALTRGRPATGAALGTLGEGLGQLALAARSGSGSRHVSAEEWSKGLERQLACVAGLLVERQISPARAAELPVPARAAGAWLAGGITQVDDQQHALSALLVYRALLARREGSAR